ncbi:MarR family winged helix-turn-helix transcriptional regulator [Noviherbaspirillum saxi]|uniref:MarR family transcriptional regulator n=1 Tax=Noviherbaspirillum saxi TaxID=2320863 RepID=A0A3A3FSS5_9BURK|nr:MarR family winged helix-turn-helix transcriptional regulator [Noviherbaspirillum saxi]RJF99267.1 MarR family transcriptional regulator [Noviherbaspirillum saxi]
MPIFDRISTPIESRIANGFARINTAMRSRAWSQAAANGLTPTQADILNLLASRTALLRLSSVAEQLAITAATASDAVSALVTKGLVEKTRAADDGRAIALKLTKSGARLAVTVADWSSFLGTAAQTLASEEQAVLLKLIVKMIRELQERGEIPVNRMCATCKYFGPNEGDTALTPHYCHFVKAPFGNQHLRLDCPEHEEAEKTVQFRNWATFAAS